MADQNCKRISQLIQDFDKSSIGNRPVAQVAPTIISQKPALAKKPDGYSKPPFGVKSSGFSRPLSKDWGESKTLNDSCSSASTIVSSKNSEELSPKSQKRLTIGTSTNPFFDSLGHQTDIAETNTAEASSSNPFLSPPSNSATISSNKIASATFAKRTMTKLANSKSTKFATEALTKFKHNAPTKIKNTSTASSQFTARILHIDKEFFTVDTDALTRILDRVPDLPIVIFSINGSSREGKSYVLNYFIRYLKYSETNPNWFHQQLSPEEEFSWRSGRERETVGINVYAEPFVRTLEGRQVAILLLDCQGLFDQHTTFQQNAVIYALSNLLSSVMIYNVKCKIEENLLQNIQYFSSYAKAISSDEAVEEELPHFMFLLRDFEFVEYDFGYHCQSSSDITSDNCEGNYFEDTMTAKDSMPVELQTVRNEILSSYADVGMFILPMPGRDFVRNSSDHQPDQDFQDYLKKFIELMHTGEHCITKKIGGVEVLGRQLKEYIEIWGEECASSATKFPAARSIAESTIFLQNEVAANNAFAAYKQHFSKFLNSDEAGVSDAELEKYHEELVSYANQVYTSMRKMGDETIVGQYLEKIQNLCDAVFQDNYFPMNAEIRKRLEVAEEFKVKQAGTEAFIRKMQYEIEQLKEERKNYSTLKAELEAKFKENQKLQSDRREIQMRLNSDIGNALPQLGKQREFFGGIKDHRLSVRKTKVTRELFKQELEKAKKEREDLYDETRGSWDVNSDGNDAEDAIYSEAYEDAPKGIQGSYRVFNEDEMDSKFVFEKQQEQIQQAKLRAANAKIHSLSKKLEEIEKPKKKKKWWQFW